jgi:hypothetical protein
VTMDFEMNPGWEDALRRHLRPAMQEFADNHQSRMDSFSRQYAGRPVSDIKPVLAQELASWGASLSGDAGLTRITTAISEGQAVVLRAG